MLKQAVLLVGGRGTRLKHLTQATPKPLIHIDGRPFLDILVEEAARHGFTDILLLAGYLGEQVRQRYEGRRWRGATVLVLIEPEPLGTAGALKFAGDRLAPEFLLVNGDTFFDINLRALACGLPAGGGAMALRAQVSGARYGRVGLDGDRVARFHSAGERDSGPINGGVYALSRDILADLPDGASSLDSAVFPRLASEGLLKGIEFDGYFIDMGVPEDLEQARRELPARLRRPALFLDRDGVINHDKGYLHKPSDFVWVTGAKQAIRAANDLGWFVFVVTNQSGVARGFYDEAAIGRLHDFVADELAAEGAHVDAFEYCPHHPEGTVENYRGTCRRRKPAPGMIEDLLRDWPVWRERSFLVGDMPHDVAAAEAAGIPGFRFPGGNLMDFIRPLLQRR